MVLTQTQAELLRCLRSAAASEASRNVVYCTEYLGYLPFGQYHWVEVNGKDIDLQVWFSCADFDALEGAGMLRKIHQWTNAEDELESKTTYEIVQD